jgi:hypothetical protein
MAPVTEVFIYPIAMRRHTWPTNIRVQIFDQRLPQPSQGGLTSTRAEADS